MYIFCHMAAMVGAANHVNHTNVIFFLIVLNQSKYFDLKGIFLQSTICYLFSLY